ncbi:hypothetical protein ACRE_024530 [Hapsidospora chrysogenum ATCC 11550]|uniref:LsmAD domain-containing protein n=1 Tax=Hapsidospora chrysogenum (strain ATCC 11550 / CBS 779.69 / DSM 880 / IAM 14645 / JCM 23072 / IMI 49137) TaxID=857340 RepID=A0A086TBQ7_HAPC1|nr:hypothetical protein ACRE_024530 [Hapsidospora chrysogenum ATCC 11550]
MPGGKRDGTGGGGNVGRSQNGTRSGFRTDTAISNSRHGNERPLQPWVPDASDTIDGSLEKSASPGSWDQFAANERLFGLKTDYDENIYTTAINKSHPQYREKVAAAERKAREIERSAPTTAHVAEERVMDYVGGNENDGENEEDKYSGVRRQEFPAPGGRENKYTPPAMRPPASHSTVKGAPVDPAIITSQLKAPGKKMSTPTPEEGKDGPAETSKNGVASSTDGPRPAQPATRQDKAADTTTASVSRTPDDKIIHKTNTPAHNSASTSRNRSPQVKEGTPSATSTVERDVLNSFKSFASQQRETALKVRNSKREQDKVVKLTELKKFANSFKLSTPVPGDLVSIIAKDPAKQKEIQAKAIKNAEDVAKSKAAEAALKDKSNAAKEMPSKPAEQSSAKNPADTRVPRGPNGPQIPPQGGAPNRHPGHRQQYPQQPYRQYGNNRGGPPQQPAGTLSQRLRNVEQQKFSQSSTGYQHVSGPEGRPPPTGPASSVDPSINRRLSGVPAHVGAKLNPTSHEFRPRPLAPSFNPAGQPSAGSSPRSAGNDGPEPAARTASAAGRQLIRRKTKAVDPNKCNILSHIQKITPPPGRDWKENGGLRPSYDTLPTWRQVQDDEKPDSTMRLTYKEYFERQPFSGSAMATPNPPPVVPHMAHQHQLPFHLQQGGPNMGPRQSPHMGHMQMHTPQHGLGPHQPYGHDDHRMVHSNSAQSFASPRLGQAAMAYPGVNSPAQLPYNQPVYMGPGTPQMGQFRSFSGNPPYIPPQQGQMGGPVMMQPHFVPGPQGMVGGPQMMYPGAHAQFLPPGGPPQPGPGATGYPSPGRPAAPMMAHQGSQQGQPMYGMSPNVQHSQPAYGHLQQHPGGPSHAGPQQFGSSPQQGHQQSGQHQQRSGSNTYGRNQGVQGQQHQQQQPLQQLASGQNRGTEGSDEAK